ncbi:ribonuclease H-like domain-containing protein, partial [Tanacetum coccineum]
DEDIADDSSKQGRILSDAEVQEKASNETEPVIQDVTPTEVIQDQESSEKGSAEVSTAGAKKGTASEEVPIVSTAEVNLSTAGGTVTYTRRSAEKRSRQDKGKAIMIESEPKKKSKKELEQERLSFAEAIRLEEQMNEEQRAQIARDEEIARQWDEEERQRAMSEAKTSKKIDWNDPSVIRYHTLKMKPKTVAQARRNMIKYLKNQGNYKISDFKGMSYNEIRPIFEKVWDFNQQIEPMDSEHGSEIMKSPEKMKSAEKIEEEDVDTQEEMKEVVKEPGAKRKKSIPRKSTRKRQKMEEDAEKEELKGFLDIIPREEVPIKVESLSTKFPIVDWMTCVLIENFMYYQILKGDGSSKNYKFLSEMLEDFDRQDVEELYRLNGIAIHMLTEKKYPLSQEMISKMLKRKLEVDHESSQAFKLLGSKIFQEKELILLMVKAADLEISMHGDYYGMLEVIENGNSWVPIPVTAPESGPSTALKMTVPSTAEEKICKKNDVKAQSLLLMALPNEHQLTFNQYVDAQSMFAAIKAGFGGNEATKRSQKALLKQQYENFNASSSESLDSIFNRLQKLVSRLAILGVVTPLEDLNVKFLRSLPSEWDTHVVVWMNKPDFDTMGLDDLYNNFKIVEQKVKRSTGAINDEKNLAFLTTTGASSINNINTVNLEVSTGQEKVYQRTGRKDIIDGSSTAGYDTISKEHQGVKTTKLESRVAHIKGRVDDEEDAFCKKGNVCYRWEEEPKKARKNNDAPIIEDWVSDDEDEVEPIPKVEKKTVIPTAIKKEFVKLETPVRRSVRSKDETSEILKNFIKEVENLVDKKVKIIRSEIGTEFKNKVMDEFCREKDIKREYSVARTPQQNGVAERKNRTLIELL